jgi:hypothetical protein
MPVESVKQRMIGITDGLTKKELNILLAQLVDALQVIMAKLDALIANEALLQGTRYAMSEEIFEKAKFDILTSKYN